MKSSRRSFIKKTAAGATGVTLGASALGFSAKSYGSILGSNDRINISVIGVRGQGNTHLKQWAEMSKSNNVFLHTICDVDEELWPERVNEVAGIQGKKPKTEYDMRRVYDNKEIDAVSIATPNHWHALATIWGVQAGKDVYVEKPSSHNIWEGRKMVEAARKYNKIVQVGFQNRSIENVRKAMSLLHDGVIGDVYMARGLCYKPRASFGISPDAEPPKGLHYDLWVGPAEMQPYNEKRLHYNWHWHWNTGNGDIGNQGPHQFDVARWGMGKDEHPVKVTSYGGYYKYGKDECSQETANTQTASFEYADGKILQFEVRGLFTGGEDNLDVKIGNLFYGTEGWMEVNGSQWRTFMGPKGEPGPSSEEKAKTEEVHGYLAAPGGGGHYNNFIAAVRSSKRTDLTCDIEEGYLSSCLPHMANISYRLGSETLHFDGKSERFTNSEKANKMLSRNYREPFVVSDKV
ncbi:MAG: Gfo/Idh/MocA family oxidoreductase [Cyclobacteriaceae bacterium]|nr:Gfo/Idh/MocA family oxidoreductase [Cyclobacteriaceae bacterium]